MDFYVAYIYLVIIWCQVLNDSFNVLLCMWQRQRNPDYDNDLQLFLPRKIVLRRVQMSDTVCSILEYVFWFYTITAFLDRPTHLQFNVADEFISIW